MKICAKGEPELVRAKAFERIERQRERTERCEKLLMETMESLHGAMLQESGEVKAKLAEAECCGRGRPGSGRAGARACKWCATG